MRNFVSIGVLTLFLFSVRTTIADPNPPLLQSDFQERLPFYLTHVLDFGERSVIGELAAPRGRKNAR